MQECTRSQVSYLDGVGSGVDGNAESRKTIAVLEALLEQSIHLRNLYKNARWQTAELHLPRLRQLLECNYQEQLQLVDLLTDRIRTLGGEQQIFASRFLQHSSFASALRGQKALIRLWREVLDAHELVLNTARPNVVYSEGPWARDFAVGRVVLANEAQSISIGDQLAAYQPIPRIPSAPSTAALNEG